MNPLLTNKAVGIICIALLVAIVLITQRIPIGRLIDRIVSVRWPGGGMRTSPAPNQTSGANTQETLSQAQQFFRSFDNPLIIRLEDQIRAGLPATHSSDEREKILVRIAAATIAISRFEKIHSDMYRSQFDALNALNATPGGLVKADIRRFFGEGAARTPMLYPDTFTVERWLSFLTSWQLATQEDELIKITLDGREFLRYVIGRGYAVGSRLG